MSSFEKFLLFEFLLFLYVGNALMGEPPKLKTILDLFFNNRNNNSYSASDDSKAYDRLDCPLCDSSVYSYCSEKLLHDACCCLNPYEHKLPYQCKFADCSFLHANSCREHKLITACCCSKVHSRKNPVKASSKN